MKLNTGFPLQKWHSIRRKYFHQQIGQKFGEEANEMLHYEHTFMVLEKDGEDHLSVLL
jgi:hypothetical protein